MAESMVTFFLKKVGALLEGKANLLFGVKEKVRSLGTELEFIRSFLRDADEKRTKNNERSVNVWVSQVRDEAYNVEDVINLFIPKEERQRWRNMALRIIGYPNQLLTIHLVAKQIQDIKKRLKGISANAETYGLNKQLGESSGASLNQVLENRAPLVEEADVVGFHRDAEKLATLLVGGEARENHSVVVVSIVGMGGLGKTTLAKKVYNRFDVKKHFDSCAWVYVSKEYGPKDLLLSIIKQVGTLTQEEKALMNEEELGRTLSNYLKEKKYLIVMDDIWKVEDWDRLKFALPNEEGKGSRVLLTTRNKEVALYADPNLEPHGLHLLDEGESWELFTKKVVSCPAELEELGKKIVAKCSGLPLAIVVLGGLLCTKEKTHGAWLYLSGQLEKLPNLVDFPPNLTKLSLHFSGLAIGRQQEDEDEPQAQNQIMATLEQLPNLRVLSLGKRSYEEKEMIFTEGGFPKLQDLHIDDLENLEEWRVEKGATPCLQSLYLDSCDRLKMLPDGLRHVTTLQKFYLYRRNNPGLKDIVEKDRGEDCNLHEEEVDQQSANP
ncbi:hypothetical protein HHK36_014513 [Tetracentron sinense]|uniref:Uncharacterized protein n=1 Tax=Tetracentron sinense TaxID=13715 RepID=A0A835DC12_TETSI|nr:hypothetical protein HHK36_014513 [Tetracentron sinense]